MNNKLNPSTEKQFSNKARGNAAQRSLIDIAQNIVSARLCVCVWGGCLCVCECVRDRRLKRERFDRFYFFTIPAMILY